MNTAEAIAKPSEFYLFLVCCVGSVLLGLGCFISGVQRWFKVQKEPQDHWSIVPELFGALSVMLPVLGAQMLWSKPVEAMRQGIELAYARGDDAAQFINSVSLQSNTMTAFGAGLLGGTFWSSIGVVLLLSVRLRGSERIYSNAAAIGTGLLGASLFLVTLGAVVSVLELNVLMQSIVKAEPEAKAVVLNAGLGELEALLSLGALSALAMCIPGVVLLIRAIQRAEDISLKPGLAIVYSIVSVAIGIALFVESFPYQKEVHLPVKGNSNPYAKGIHRFTVPALVGPDTIQRAPMLVIDHQSVEVEGVAVKDPESLLLKLREMRKVDEMMHPGRQFQGVANILIDPKRPVSGIARYFHPFLESGYQSLHLVFNIVEPSQARPLVGEIAVYNATSLMVKITDRLSPEAVELELRAVDSYLKFCKSALGLTKTGKDIEIVIPPDLEDPAPLPAGLE